MTGKLSRLVRIIPSFSRKSTKNYLPKIKVLNLARIWNRSKSRKRISMLKIAGITNDLYYPVVLHLTYVELPSEVRYMMEIQTNDSLIPIFSKLNYIIIILSSYYPIEVNLVLRLMA